MPRPKKTLGFADSKGGVKGATATWTNWWIDIHSSWKCVGTTASHEASWAIMSITRPQYVASPLTEEYWGFSCTYRLPLAPMAPFFYLGKGQLSTSAWAWHGNRAGQSAVMLCLQHSQQSEDKASEPPEVVAGRLEPAEARLENGGELPQQCHGHLGNVFDQFSSFPPVLSVLSTVRW